MAKPQNFATRLRKARGKLSRAEAAQRIGVPVSTLINWELGHRVPDQFKQQAVLQLLA